MLDTKALAEATAEIVKAHIAAAVPAIVEAATELLLRRIEQLEARQPERGEKGEDGSDGVDGRDGAPGPAGEDGAPGRDGLDGEHGAPGKDGRDGVGLAGALIDRSGELVLTLSDGTVRQLGTVLGKDGADGQPGRNGADGRDGADGLGFDDLSVEHDGERCFSFKFTRGEQTKSYSFRLPVIIDRGVFKADTAYERGDAVSWGGSIWIAQADAPAAKPGEGDGWRLAVKKGRDGKDGRNGEPGLRGPEGRPGRDLTQLGYDGKKW